MASDLFVFDNSYTDIPLSSFTDSTSLGFHHDYDILQAFQDSLNQNHQVIQELEILSSSPPSPQLESLCLEHITSTQTFPNATDSPDFSGLEEAVRFDGFQLCFDPISEKFSKSFLPQRCSLGAENAAERPLPRSHSSNSFDPMPPCFSFQPHFATVLESPNSHHSPETNFPIRRVSSTGDLQKMNTTSTRNVMSSRLSCTKGLLMEEPNFKVGRYTAEERKERIERYRAKRTQRKFHKTIKYACRKTLADNRARIRGRFARNDEAVGIPKRYDEEDDLLD